MEEARLLDVNVSQVLQTALQSVVRQRRRRHQEQTDLESRLDLPLLRERFGKEREDLYRDGFRIGLSCIDQLRYADLRAAESLDWDTEAVFKSLPQAVRDEFQERSLARFGSVFTDSANHANALLRGAQDEMADGFLGALRRVWELAAGEQTIAEQVQELKAQVDAAQARIAALRRDRDRHLAAEHRAEAELAALSAQLRSHEASLMDAKRSYDKSSTEVDNFEYELEVRRRAALRLEDENAALKEYRQILEALADQRLALLDRLVGADRQVKELEHQLAEDRAEEHPRRLALERARAERFQLEDQLAESQAALATAQARLQELVQHTSGSASAHFAPTDMDGWLGPVTLHPDANAARKPKKRPLREGGAGDHD
jgi:hypothetical protein